MKVNWRGLFLAGGMLLSGSMGSLLTGWQNRSESEGRDGEKDDWEHPFIQTFLMFLGESLCGVVFLSLQFSRSFNSPPPTTGRRPASTSSVRSRSDSELKSNVSSSETEPLPLPYPISFYFFVPSLCDLTATSLLYTSLLYTTLSVQQMLRGGTVFFTALFSTLFLGKRLDFQQYLGIVLVIIGISLVGLASLMYGSEEGAPNPLLGDVLVIIAQVVAATQFVVEEKFLSTIENTYRVDVPALKAVGIEGLWGMFLLCFVLPIIYFIRVDGDRMEDTYDALIQIKNNSFLGGLLAVNVFTTAFFNFFGISITKYMSATHRKIIDSCRSFVVWIVSIMVGWEEFLVLQMLGFFVLVLGTFLYNKVFYLPHDLVLWLEINILPPFCYRTELYHKLEDPYNDEKPLIDNMSTVSTSPSVRRRSEQTLPFEIVEETPNIRSASIDDHRRRYYDKVQAIEETGQFLDPSIPVDDIPLREYRTPELGRREGPNGELRILH